MRQDAVRLSQHRKPIPRPKRVSQRRARVLPAPPPREDAAPAVSEPRPAPVVECADCRLIEAVREVDTHREGLGLVALGALLVFAAYKVTKVAGVIQRG